MINEDGHVLFSARFYGTSGELICEINENEIITNLTSWDIEWKGKTLTIREGGKKIILKIKFFPNSIIHVLSMDMRKGNFSIQMNDSGKIYLNGGIDLRYDIIICGGAIKITDVRFTINGGSIISPFPKGYKKIRVTKEGQLLPSIDEIKG